MVPPDPARSVSGVVRAPAFYYANVAAIFCTLVCLGIIWFGLWTQEHMAPWFIQASGLDPGDPEVQKLYTTLPQLGKILVVKGCLLAPFNLVLILLRRTPFTYLCHWSNLCVMAILFFPIGIPMLRAFSATDIKRAYGLKVPDEPSTRATN